MAAEFYNPENGQEDQTGSAKRVRSEEDCADVRGGARQSDQIENFKSGQHSENDQAGNSSQGDSDTEHRDSHTYPRDGQTWPENKTPTK